MRRGVAASINSSVETSFHSVPTYKLVVHPRRSHVPAATLSELAHAVTPGPRAPHGARQRMYRGLYDAAIATGARQTRGLTQTTPYEPQREHAQG